jgi:gliding motility-associated-like protein
MKKLISFLLLFFALNSFSQKEANFWYFGRNAALDFTSGNPVALNDGALNTNEGSATISNKLGELLFYTDGSTVFNKNHAIMSNGGGLLGDQSSSQSAIIVPKPENDDIYYIFTVTNRGGFGNGVKFSEVDITLDGGLGEVIVKNTDLIQSNNAEERITAVKGDECNTFWVITGDRNEFQAYKVDKDGVNTTAITSPYSRAGLGDSRGYLKTSPDGTKLVSAYSTAGTFIYNFSDIDGTVTNGRLLDLDFENGYGVEFSRNSQKLYLSTGGHDQGAVPGQANVYQYSLDSDNIVDINNSRVRIANDNSGFRGALQLASNGKIYYSRSSTFFLGVINSPENNAATDNVDYDPQGISLNGQLASEGLPPFIQSFFLPVVIKDSDTDNTVNNQDLQYCIGDNKTIVPDGVSGTFPTYKWEFDNGTTSSIIATTPTLTLNNLQKVDSGKYSLTIELIDDCGDSVQYDGTFNVGVFEASRAKATPDSINFCDTDLTTPNSFDLSTLKNTEILDGLDPTIFNVKYYDTLAKSTANVIGTELPNPYEVNTASLQTIYVRVDNKNAPNACFALTEFELEVTNEPEPIQPTVYRLCDDTTSAGGDTDGITDSFRLSTKDSEILGTLSATQYAVSYHTLLADAQTSTTTNAIDKNADYQVNNSQTIYVRVENIDNANCNTVSDDTAGSSFMSFQLIVDALPIIKTNPVIIKQCDDNPDLITTFNLTEAEISISDNRANETFEYYASEAEAIAGTPEVADKVRYPVSNTGEAWVKTISEFGCYRISKIELIVSFAGDVNYTRNFIECDDLLDADGNNTAANSDTDGISFFDFSDAEQEILDLFPVLIQPNLEVLFYESTADRTASLNEILNITNHRNNNDPTYANSQTIFVRIKNKVNNDCTGIGQFTLTVNSTPLANTPIDLNLCDDDASGSTVDGENSGINLRDNVDDILGTTQTEADYIVSFHTSATGANTNTDIITNDTNFTNSAQTGFALGDISEQTIYVRVQNRNATTQCFNDHVSFKITVNPVPTVSATITPIAVCDIVTPSDSDPRNRIAQNIDLTSKDTEILDGKINHRVAYFATQQDAQDGNEISNPTIFQNITSETNFPADFSTDDPGIETIFFKVFDLGGNMCESVFATFQLLIYPEPNIPNNISDYSDCDNTTDSFADDANGINGDITLKNKIPEILVNYLPSEFADFSITFYTSLADAESGNTALALDENIFENNANNQTIYVRVENTKNTPIACVHTGLSFNISIKPIPNFTVMGEEDIDTPQIVCLNDTPLTLEAENPAATYDYTWTNEAGTTLGTNATLDVVTEGKYTVIATDQSPDGCSRKRIIVVNESNVAILKESFITIIDESNNISSNDNISISIDTISNDLGPGDYQFAVRNDDNGERFPIIGFQDEPLFENLEGGIYTIIVNDKNGCSPDTELQISVIQFPKFFTPNGDGKNDTWVIKGANKTFYPNSSINIFNRYGKLVAQLPIESQGWDGTYNGKKMPSNDYWFNVQLIPADTNRSPVLKKGHFSLLRR